MARARLEGRCIAVHRRPKLKGCRGLHPTIGGIGLAMVVMSQRGGSVKISSLSDAGSAEPIAGYLAGTQAGDVLVGLVGFLGLLGLLGILGCLVLLQHSLLCAAPPQFDPVAYVASIDRLLAANFDKLYLTHFDAVPDVKAHLTAYRARITEVHQRVAAWHAAGWTEGQIREGYREAEHALGLQCGLTPEQWDRCEASNGTAMCADGVRLHCLKSAKA